MKLITKYLLVLFIFICTILSCSPSSSSDDAKHISPTLDNILRKSNMINKWKEICDCERAEEFLPVYTDTEFFTHVFKNKNVINNVNSIGHLWTIVQTDYTSELDKLRNFVCLQHKNKVNYKQFFQNLEKKCPQNSVQLYNDLLQKFDNFENSIIYQYIPQNDNGNGSIINSILNENNENNIINKTESNNLPIGIDDDIIESDEEKSNDEPLKILTLKKGVVWQYSNDGNAWLDFNSSTSEYIEKHFEIKVKYLEIAVGKNKKRYNIDLVNFYETDKKTSNAFKIRRVVNGKLFKNTKETNYIWQYWNAQNIHNNNAGGTWRQMKASSSLKCEEGKINNKKIVEDYISRDKHEFNLDTYKGKNTINQDVYDIRRVKRYEDCCVNMELIDNFFNLTRCKNIKCKATICTECFLEMKNHNSSNSEVCPICKTPYPKDSDISDYYNNHSNYND